MKPVVLNNIFYHSGSGYKKNRKYIEREAAIEWAKEIKDICNKQVSVCLASDLFESKVLPLPLITVPFCDVFASILIDIPPKMAYLAKFWIDRANNNTDRWCRFLIAKPYYHSRCTVLLTGFEDGEIAISYENNALFASYFKRSIDEESIQNAVNLFIHGIDVH